jgi:hypothetical protein
MVADDGVAGVRFLFEYLYILWFHFDVSECESHASYKFVWQKVYFQSEQK